jgi:CheY-like chemotaxis protein
MADIRILWADDEIELLKPQLFFLEKKGYQVTTVTNGYDALEILGTDQIDVIFLDESMPGITGLETLEKIKVIKPNIPVVMITKNEAENLMEEAIGSQIDDYLIKPVNPNQILLTLKKLIDNKRLVREKMAMDYQQEFRQLSMDIDSSPNFEEWVSLYKRIINWETKLESSDNEGLFDILHMQKKEANRSFVKFVEKNYLDWLNGDGPSLSHTLFRDKVFKEFSKETPTVFLLLDNLRYDQWKVLEPVIAELYRIDKEDYFYSILPTSTQYSRNAIFAGMTPLDISKNFKDKWLNDNEDGGKNMNEDFFLDKMLQRSIKDPIRHQYMKVTSANSAKDMADKLTNVNSYDLTVIVYNFIDMLSHARTEMAVLKELAPDEKAYLSLTKSWFMNSPLWTALQKLAEKKCKLIITTDHGTIRVSNPSKVIADRETTTNLRYKVGKNLRYQKQDVADFSDPDKIGLPSPNISSRFIFAKEESYFLYPNNYNHFMNHYANSFQHGGISMQEMICPFVVLTPKI